MKILFNYDGSDDSRKALVKGKVIALDESADVTILTVVNNEVDNPATAGGYGDFHSELSEENRKKGQALLEQAKHDFGSYPTEVNLVMKEGKIADQIIMYAEDNEIDLMIMGRRGRDNMGRSLLGSVTNKLLNSLNISVLIVRERENEAVWGENRFKSKKSENNG